VFAIVIAGALVGLGLVGRRLLDNEPLVGALAGKDAPSDSVAIKTPRPVETTLPSARQETRPIGAPVAAVNRTAANSTNTPEAPAEHQEAPGPASPKDANAGSASSFFNGTDLGGWEGSPGAWRVEQGTLIGSARTGQSGHAFLGSKQKYKDFDIKFQARLSDAGGISGIQFRSRLADAGDFRVVGPQCAIREKSSSNEYPAGSFRTAPEGKPDDVARATKLARVYRQKDFNQFQIHCQGKHVVIKLNGYTMVNAEIPSLPDEGIIAWELSGGSGSAEVRFRKIEFADLSRSNPLKEDRFPPDLSLLQAESAYTAALHKANEELLHQFDAKIKALSGKSSRRDSATDLITVQKEKEAFQGKGLYPWSKQMRKPLQDYMKATEKAQENMVKQLTQAMSRGTKLGNGKALDDLGELTGSLLAPHVVSAWRRANQEIIQLLSDGTTTAPGAGNEDRVGYWSLDHDLLQIFIPNPTQVEEYDVRLCLFARDGKSLQVQSPNGPTVTWNAADD
jgi:hypothetical protein